MSTNGSTSVQATSHDILTFSWAIDSQSVANNTSLVRWTLTLTADSYGKIISSASKSWSVIVNGTSYSGTNTIALSNSSSKTLASGTTTIAHNTDGTKTFNYSFSQELSITFSGSWVGTVTGSGSGTLTSISRASTLTVGNGTLGTAQTITATRNLSSYTHSLTWTCGTHSGTICTKSSATSWSFTPAISLADAAPNATTVYCEFTLATYSGSSSTASLIGSVVKGVTLTIPASVVPSCTLSIADAMGYLDTFGGYIQNRSALRVAITASGAYGSTVRSYSTTVNGATYTASQFDTDVLSTVGDNTITTKVTDSRGRSVTVTQTFSVLAYSAPRITKLSVHRCASATDGTEDAEGSYCQVTCSYTITELTNNAKSAVIQYRPSGEESWSSLSLDAQYSAVNQTAIFEADPESSFDVQLVIGDSIITDITKSTSVSTGYTLMHFAASGKGLAIGKQSEADELEVNMAAEFYQSVTIEAHDSPVGTIITASDTGITTTIDSATWTTICTITLPPGTWILAAEASLTSGNYKSGLSIHGANTSYSSDATMYANQLSWANVTAIRKPSVETTYYLNAYQASGSSASVNPRAFRALRIT